jgi:hypothetical protein
MTKQNTNIWCNLRLGIGIQDWLDETGKSNDKNKKSCDMVLKDDALWKFSVYVANEEQDLFKITECPEMVLVKLNRYRSGRMERLRNLQSNIDRNPPAQLGESVANCNTDEISNKKQRRNKWTKK